jgi:hypothetical protein
MSADPQTPWRLAIRDQGNFVAAYLAPTGSMDDAVLVATLARTFAMVPGAFDAWKQALTGALVGALSAAGMQVLDVEEHAPPEHERAGHA